MNKKQYSSPDLEVVSFKLNDVILVSMMIVDPEDTASGGVEGGGGEFGDLGD